MKGQATLEGMEELSATLSRLQQGTRTKILKPAIRAALKPVQKAVKAEASRLSPNLKRGIGIKVYAKNGKVGGLVGPTLQDGLVTQKDGAQVLQNLGKIWHLIEFGRGPVTAGVKSSGGRNGRRTSMLTGKKVLKSGGTGPGTFYGSSVAAWPGDPILRSAWGRSKAEAEQILGQRAQKEIYKLVAKGKLK